MVLDEGLPKVTGDLNVTAQPITLVGLGDQGGNLVLVTATVDLDIQGGTAVKGAPLQHRAQGRPRARPRTVPAPGR